MEYSSLCVKILDASLRVKKGERVWIDGWDHTAGLVTALSLEAGRRGCEVVSTVRDEGAWLRSLKTGSIASLKKLSPIQSALLKETDSYVFTLGPRHPVNWAEIPPERRKLATIWLIEQNDFVREWRSISTRRAVKMVGIEATLATEERALALGLNHRSWRRMMYEACFLDYGQLAETTRKLVRHLRGDAEVQLSTPSGTDLRFQLDSREVEFSDGLATEKTARDGGVVFLPPGAVGTTVDEGSVEGTIVYDSPIRFPDGRVDKLTLMLRSGRIEDCGAASGVGALKSYLRKARGDANRFAFFGIGLNPKLCLGFMMDDRVLGSVELNFGANQRRGGKNRGDSNWWGTVSKATLTVGRHRVLDVGRILG